MREIVRLKQGFKYFQENKFWIIAILYTCSIVKEVIWFSVFGINILSYISIQDTLILFFNHTIILAILYLNYLMFTLFFSNLISNKIEKIITFILFLLFSFVYFELLKKPLSIIFFIVLFYLFSSFYKNKDYKNILKFSLVFLIAFSTIEPLTQAFKIKSTLNIKKNNISFEWNETNMDYYTFTYENEKIDTKLKKFFLIGSNQEYFFVFDASKNRSLIIPKASCKNISAEFEFL